MLTAPRKPLKQFQPETPTLALGSLTRNYAELDCGSVAYLRHGPAGAPPLLLVHGVPTSARLWEPLLGTLGQHYDCIVPDLLGLGRSMPRADTPLASPGQADMLAALLDTLGIERAHGVFHDQGGAHGGQMIKRHPDYLDAVLFTNCVCYDNWPVPIIDAMMRLGPLIKPLAKTHLVQTATAVIGWPQTTLRTPIPKALRTDWDHALNTGGAALDHWIAYLTAQTPDWTHDAVPALRAWDKPAHVLWAAHDRFLPPSWAVPLARDLIGPEARPELLPFAGHFWQTEVPASGADAIHRFFDRMN